MDKIIIFLWAFIFMKFIFCSPGYKYGIKQGSPFFEMINFLVSITLFPLFIVMFLIKGKKYGK